MEMMDAETKAALERFRSHEWWGEKLERDDEDTCLPREADAHRIVQLALSEHLPDDDEPVSEEWLLEIGWEVKWVGLSHWYSRIVPCVEMYCRRSSFDLLVGSTTATWYVVSRRATRGQVRRLLRALMGE